MDRPGSHSLEDVRQQAEYDRHMSMARVCRMRGDYAQAAESLRLALKVKPESLEAQEFAADILAARGELEKAAEVYKALLEADPKLASVEQKFARLTVQMAEAKRQQELLKDMAENPGKYRHSIGPRSPAVAAILSTAPGFGQIYCGQFVKGMVIFVSVMLLWFLSWLMVPNLHDVDGEKLKFLVNNLSPMGLVFFLLAASIHVYAFVDAPVYAGKLNAKETRSMTEPE